MATLILTRQQLYDRAWTTPIDNLAKELGLSGRGLGKLCARHNIPVPPRGYWAKKAFGKRVKQPPLPSPETAGYKLHFNGPSTVAVEGNDRSDLHPLIAFEELAANRIAVPDDLAITDPLILKTQRLLNRSKRDANGIIAEPKGGLQIHT